MTDTPSNPADDAPESAQDTAAERDARHLATLSELAEIGLSLAHAAAERAEAATEPSEILDAARDFELIAREVCLTVALHAKLSQARPSRPTPRSREAAAAPARLEDRRGEGRRRRAMARFIAGTAIEAQARGTAEVERLYARLDARLAEEGRSEADFAEIDPKALAFAICQDLGADPDPRWWRESWEDQAP